jgi:phage recombination protein Bet
VCDVSVCVEIVSEPKRQPTSEASGNGDKCFVERRSRSRYGVMKSIEDITYRVLRNQEERVNEVIEFTESQVSQVVEHYKDIQNGPLSPAQARALLTRCAAANADPLAGHIIPQIRNAKDDNGQWLKRMTLVTSIDFLRLVADRTGEYSPGKDTEFGQQWPRDEKSGFPGAPEWAKSFVRKFAKNTWHEYGAQAFFREYVQLKRNGEVASMWEKMPYGMLEKCAEAKALRRGFPNELQGLYSHEEMQQADNGVDSSEPPSIYGAVPRKATSEAQGRAERETAAQPPVLQTTRHDPAKVDKRTEFPFGTQSPAEKAIEEKFGAKAVATVPLSPQGEATASQELPPAVTAPSTPPDSSQGNVAQNNPIIPPMQPPTVKHETISRKRDRCISRPQQARLWALMGKSKRTKDDLKSFLKAIKTQDHPEGLESADDIPVNIYDVVCEWIEGGK